MGHQSIAASVAAVTVNITIVLSLLSLPSFKLGVLAFQCHTNHHPQKVSSGIIMPSTTFAIEVASHHQRPPTFGFSRSTASTVALMATAEEKGREGGKKLRKRRKRKKSVQDGGQDETRNTDTSSTADSDMTSASASTISTPPLNTMGDGNSLATTADVNMDLSELRAIADFRPNTSIDEQAPSKEIITAASTLPTSESSFNTELPDIRNTKRRKEAKKKNKEREQKKEKDKKSRRLVDRNDRKAVLQLLEEQPLANPDDPYFQKEEYGTISALLGEGSKSVLGIGSGPLQLGHTFGALALVLMAFVEYPGFPLTNLPSQLRGALQGGLAVVYTINFFLSILAVFRAIERGQSPLIWGAKTLTVGGLALDQVTQLPIPEEKK